MPSLNWIGKEAVVNHHREVPYHLLRCDEKLSVGDPGSGPFIADNSDKDWSILQYLHDWCVRPIGEVVQVLGGGTSSTTEPVYWESGVHPFCTPNDMASLTDLELWYTERHLTDTGLAKVSSGQLPVVGPLHRHVVSTLRQILHLAALWDALLPKLISGELWVKDAKRSVGRYV